LSGQRSSASGIGLVSKPQPLPSLLSSGPAPGGTGAAASRSSWALPAAISAVRAMTTPCWPQTPPATARSFSASHRPVAASRSSALSTIWAVSLPKSYGLGPAALPCVSRLHRWSATNWRTGSPGW